MRTFFDVESPADLTGWTSLADLCRDSGLLEARADALGHADRRAAASVDFLGVAARVLSPAVRSAVDTGRVPCLTPSTVWWRSATPGPVRLALFASAEGTSLVADVVAPLMIPLVHGYATTFRLSYRVLWGDVASALNGAVVSLGRGVEYVASVLSEPPFAGRALSLPPSFVRNSCCLYYRLAPGSFCGDCILAQSL